MKEEEENNIGIVKQLYDAYKRHDISSVLDMFTDHAVLHGPAPAGVLPWGGIFDGRGRIADFFKALDESLETLQFELRDFMAQGNKVVVVAAATLRSPALRGLKLVVSIIYHGRLMEPKNGAGSGFRIFIL